MPPQTIQLNWKTKTRPGMPNLFCHEECKPLPDHPLWGQNDFREDRNIKGTLNFVLLSEILNRPSNYTKEIKSLNGRELTSKH